MNKKIKLIIIIPIALFLLIALSFLFIGFKFFPEMNKIAKLINHDEISEYMKNFDLVNKVLKPENGVTINQIEHQSDMFSTWVVMQLTVNNQSDIKQLINKLGNRLKSNGWSKSKIDLIDKQIGDIKIDTSTIRNSVSWQQTIPEGNGSYTSFLLKLFFDKKSQNMLIIYREDGN